MKVREMKHRNSLLAGSPGLTGTYTSGGTILSRDADIEEEEDY